MAIRKSLLVFFRNAFEVGGGEVRLMRCRVWYKNTNGWYVAGYYIGDCSGECSSVVLRLLFAALCCASNSYRCRLGAVMLGLGGLGQVSLRPV